MGEVIPLRPRLNSAKHEAEHRLSFAPEPARALADLSQEALWHHPALLRRALRLDREHAQDLVDATFVRLLRGAESLPPGTNVVLWMYGAMNALLLARCRSHHGPRLVTAERALELTVPPPPRWARVETKQFAAALASLPPALGTVFRLHALEGQSYDEIASALSLTRGAVSARLLRARVLLKDVLVGLVGEEESA
jgi:RNA polymerase sigma-70 factor (ECF subfamily)